MKFMKYHKPCGLACAMMACALSFGIGLAVGIAELILWLSEFYNG
jgi:hypothetical protein